MTKAAMDRNGIASFTSGILTNEALNLDTATRVSVQDACPELSRTVTIPGSNEKVPINSLRKGGKRNPDLNRVYANLDIDINRQLFEEREDILKSSPQKKEHPNSVGGVPFLSSPHAKSPPRKKRDTSRVDVDLVSEKPPALSATNTNSRKSSAALEQLRPFRMAIVNRMKDKKEMLRDEKKNLQRLYAILSGVQNELSQTIVTIAFDSVGFDDQQWTEEFKLNEMIDIMLSFF